MKSINDLFADYGAFILGGAVILFVIALLIGGRAAPNTPVVPPGGPTPAPATPSLWARFWNWLTRSSATPTFSITSVSPNSGGAAGGTTAIITGTGFTPATTVEFGNQAATIINVNAAGTEIEVETPSFPAGPGWVSVHVYDGTEHYELVDGFEYT